MITERNSASKMRQMNACGIKAEQMKEKVKEKEKETDRGRER